MGSQVITKLDGIQAKAPMVWSTVFGIGAAFKIFSCRLLAGGPVTTGP